MESALRLLGVLKIHRTGRQGLGDNRLVESPALGLLFPLLPPLPLLRASKLWEPLMAVPITVRLSHRWGNLEISPPWDPRTLMLGRNGARWSTMTISVAAMATQPVRIPWIVQCCPCPLSRTTRCRHMVYRTSVRSGRTKGMVLTRSMGRKLRRHCCYERV